MRIAMSGPLEIRAGDGTTLEVAGGRLRRPAIVPALEPGQVVPMTRLMDGIWSERPPTGAVNATQALVTRLRRALPPTPIESPRPDGWPNWLERRPMTSDDRAKIRKALEAGLPEGPLTEHGPFLCYLTIDGLEHSDPRKLITLRGRIHAAARTAAEGRQTVYHATDSTITIGIRGPDAADRINQLRQALAKLITKHGWATRDEPR